MNGFWKSVTYQVTVGGLLNALVLTQSLNLLGKQFPVEGIGVVEVDLFTLLHAKMRGVIVV